jgi:hypothetical protein
MKTASVCLRVTCAWLRMVAYVARRCVCDLLRVVACVTCCEFACYLCMVACGCVRDGCVCDLLCVVVCVTCRCVSDPLHVVACVTCARLTSINASGAPFPLLI